MAAIKPSSYLELFKGGRMVRTCIGGFFGRFYIGLLTLAVLSMYTMSGYSYTLAGFGIGIIQLANCLIAPFISRAIDRRGQSKVMPLAAAIGMLATIVVMLSIHFRLPIAVAYIASIFIGFTPQVMSLTRARWSYVFRKDDERSSSHLKTAFSLEGMLDDLSFMISPALAILISARLFPEAGLLFGTICYVIGIAILLTDKTSEPDVSFMQSAAAHEGDVEKVNKKSVFLLYPFVTIFFIAMFFMGALFGFFDPGTYGMAAEIATEELAGPGFIAGTATSIVVTFIFGMLNLKSSYLKRVMILGFGVAIVYLPAAIATNLPLLYASHAIGAICYGPFSITLNQAVEHHVSASRVTESLTWMNAGMQLGMAIAPTIGGILIDMFTAQASLIATSASACCIPVLLLLTFPILRKHMQEKSAPASDGAES